MAIKTETKFLVNGKSMTNAEYLEVLKTARDAVKAYKSTDGYKREQEVKAHLIEVREKYIKQFIEFGKKQGLTMEEIGSIGLKLYQESKAE